MLKDKKFENQLVKVENPLQLKNDYQNQLYWERLQKEMRSEVTHLNELAKSFVGGSKRPVMESNLAEGEATITKDNLIIEGQQVMQSWQKRFMLTVARAASPAGKNVLEIGFGLGIASNEIQRLKPKQHTIIECNPAVFAQAEKWAEKKRKNGAKIKLILGTWQDVLSSLGKYEAILFDPYPFDETEFQVEWYDEGNFDAQFFPHAAAHLKNGGTFSYFTNEIDSLSRHHQHQLFAHFKKIEVEVVRDLPVPEDCQYWWVPQMTVVRAVR